MGGEAGSCCCCWGGLAAAGCACLRGLAGPSPPCLGEAVAVAAAELGAVPGAMPASAGPEAGLALAWGSRKRVMAALGLTEGRSAKSAAEMARRLQGSASCVQGQRSGRQPGQLGEG